MQEHELKEYQRLRAEGHWTVASEFREAERKRLRAAGRNRHDAREESWEAMLEKYPPQDGQTPSRQSAVALDRWSEANAADSESQIDKHNWNAADTQRRGRHSSSSILNQLADRRGLDSILHDS
jgi:hypothetical protein